MKTKTSTLIRLLSLIAVLANQTVAFIGNTSFANCEWYQIGSIVCTIFVAVINAWYNNDITDYAKIAGAIFDALKNGTITENDIKEVLKNGDSQ